MNPLVITHAGGSSSWASYVMPSRSRAFTRAPERAAGGGIRVLGDAREVPSAWVARVLVPGSTLASAMSDALDLVTIAEGATRVSAHEGVTTVNGILGFSIEPAGTDALVTLRFAPTSAVISPPNYVLAPCGVVTLTGLTATVLDDSVPADAVTYDGATVTYDGVTVTYGGA